MKSGARNTNRYIYPVLALSVLLNAAAGFYVLQKKSSGSSIKNELSTASVNRENDDLPGQIRSSLLNCDSTVNPQEISRTAVLNTLIERYKYRSYLEIGQGDRSKNFDWIDCKIKIGIDPDIQFNAAYQMTSDEFFAINNAMFDLIFVDGLHHADQVETDIMNALNVLNENGTIVVHDCNPKTKKMQVVPRQQKLWTGDVWKAWVKFRAARHDLKMYVVDANHGCGIIRRGTQKTITLPENLTYEALDRNREYFLNLVDVYGFLKDLKSRSPR